MLALQPGNALLQNLLALGVMVFQLILTVSPRMARAESFTHSDPFLPVIADLFGAICCSIRRLIMMIGALICTLAYIAHMQLHLSG